MGDGQHGWAAAEVVLFLRDCVIREYTDRIELFRGAGSRLMQRGKDVAIMEACTSFGRISASLEFQTDYVFNLSIASHFFTKSAPESIDVFFPWKIQKVSPSFPQHLLGKEDLSGGTKLRFASQVSSVLVQIDA